MSKYAPAREDGLKPYYVERAEWGRLHPGIYWAKDAADARCQAVGRMRYVRATVVRRATPEDMAALQ